MSHDMSHDFLRPRPPRQQRSPSPATVAEANARVSHWMQTLGRKNKYLKQISRSVSNLSDLREEDEEEAIKRWVWSVYLVGVVSVISDGAQWVWSMLSVGVVGVMSYCYVGGHFHSYCVASDISGCG